MKLLPIEAGCRALACPGNTNDIGKTPAHEVHVVDRYPILQTCMACGAFNRAWQIESEIFRADRVTIWCECGLTRIDGNPDQEREVVKDLEVCV